jgi:cytochrome P450
MASEGTGSDLYYDPFDFVVDANAHAIWRRMRDEAPVYWNEEHEFFALSRYDDVLQAILDVDTFSSLHGTTLGAMTPEPVGMPMIIFMDPPQHTWLRKVVNRAFTPRIVGALEERIRTVCRDLLDGLAGRSEFDLVDEYGAILPPTVILALVGLPEGHEETFRKAMDAMLAVSGPPSDAPAEPTPEQQEAGLAFGTLLFELLPKLIAERRSEPKEDLISVLVHADLDADGELRKLDDAELLSFVILLAGAGTETVARLLGWMGSLLDEHPDQRALLVDDPSLVPNAIEEALRYEAPSPVNGRWTHSDVELHGVTIPSGSKVLLLNGSGNRDERHFPDAERFDVRRDIDRHLSFGYGAHFCVGAALARLEARIALEELLARFPAWDVERARSEMVHTANVRGYAQLPVTV